MKVLFVDSCMKNGEDSRTKILCNKFIDSLKSIHSDWDFETIVLKDMNLEPYNFEKVEKRYDLINSGKTDDKMFDLANQFAGADRIIIGAPYWDLAFPSVLKIYIEHIFVGGITFMSSEKGLKGLSKGEKAIFIQTAGGFVDEKDPGTEYLKYVMKVLGIEEFKRVSADFIDVEGVNVKEKLEDAEKELIEISKQW